jgi:hypothetical protein
VNGFRADVGLKVPTDRKTHVMPSFSSRHAGHIAVRFTERANCCRSLLTQLPETATPLRGQNDQLVEGRGRTAQVQEALDRDTIAARIVPAPPFDASASVGSGAQPCWRWLIVERTDTHAQTLPRITKATQPPSTHILGRASLHLPPRLMHLPSAALQCPVEDRLRRHVRPALLRAR